MRKLIGVTVLGLSVLCACSEQHSAKATKTKKVAVVLPRKEAGIPIDTSASFKIDSYWVTPDSSFDFNSLVKSRNDTLHLVACQKYLIEPFGPIENMAQVKTSLLQEFSAKTRYVKQENGTFPFLTLTKGKNKMLLYFSTDPDESVYSSILKGEINDSSVAFANGIRVGMPAEKFYGQFFKNLPLTLQRRYRTVVFDYCVDGDVRHTYNFENGKLTAVKFSQPEGFWKLDY